jgi:DNA-binding transcriptional MocR family regulator
VNRVVANVTVSKAFKAQGSSKTFVFNVSFSTPKHSMKAVGTLDKLLHEEKT